MQNLPEKENFDVKKYFQTHKVWPRDFPFKLWAKLTSGKKRRMITFIYFFMDLCITCTMSSRSAERFFSGCVCMRALVCVASTYTDRCGGRSRWACWWIGAPGGPGRTVLPYPPHRTQIGPRSWRSQGSSRSSDVMHGFETSRPIFGKDPPETSDRYMLARPPSPQSFSS